MSVRSGFKYRFAPNQGVSAQYWYFNREQRFLARSYLICFYSHTFIYFHISDNIKSRQEIFYIYQKEIIKKFAHPKCFLHRNTEESLWKLVLFLENGCSVNCGWLSLKSQRVIQMALSIPGLRQSLRVSQSLWLLFTSEATLDIHSNLISPE